MVRIVIALLSVLALSAPCGAEPSSIAFAGERFVRKHEQQNARAGIVEFVPGDESMDGWTRLVGFHMFWDNRASPAEAAAALGRLADQRYPGAKSRVLAKGAEALVEFFARAPNSNVVEFNVFKYGRGPDVRGIVAFQYARRVRELAPKDIRRLALRWIEEAAQFDLNVARAAFKVPARSSMRRRPGVNGSRGSAFGLRGGR